MAVSKRKRFEIFKRDAFVCQYCGRTPPTIVLHCDHVEAVSNGGSDDESNLVTACEDCNLGKSNVPLGQVVQPLTELMAVALERREQVEAYNRFLDDLREAEQQTVIDLGRYWFNRMTTSKKEVNKWVFGESRAQSIRRFLKDLVPSEVLEAMDIAHARKNAGFHYDEACWKYFCGICWAKIRERKGS
jgi:HNH endonuclease